MKRACCRVVECGCQRVERETEFAVFVCWLVVRRVWSLFCRGMLVGGVFVGGVRVVVCEVMKSTKSTHALHGDDSDTQEQNEAVGFHNR